MRVIQRFVLVLVIAGVVAASPVKAHDGDHASVAECDQACQELLSVVREATAKYHEEWVALADGFRIANDCVVSAAGLGSAEIGALLIRENAAGDAPQVLIHQRGEDGQGLAVSLAPGFEERREIRRLF